MQPSVLTPTPVASLAKGEPFKVAFGPGRLEGTFDLTSVENADAMIQAINALKGLLPAKEPSRLDANPSGAPENDEAAN